MGRNTRYITGSPCFFNAGRLGATRGTGDDGRGYNLGIGTGGIIGFSKGDADGTFGVESSGAILTTGT
jgi:hypothetical protein